MNPATVADLKPASYNPRKIAPGAAAGLGVSLRHFGDISGLVFNVRSHALVAGHQRTAQLPPDAPVVDFRPATDDCGTVGYAAVVLPDGRRFALRLVDWDELTEKAANITANSPTIAGEFTGDLVDLLQDVEDFDPELYAALNLEDLENLAQEALDAEASEHPADPGPGEPPDNPVSLPGELYELGPHRLLCGDSTNADDVARLMAGEKATLMATDPPYLVNYDGMNHPTGHHIAAGRGGTSAAGGKRWDDYNEASANLFHDFLAVALPHLTPQALIYQWHASRRQVLVEQAWKDNGLLVHQTIIWAKKRPVLTRSHFLWAYEPCFYGWVEGNQPPHDRRPPSTVRNVWELDTKDLDVTGVHPAQKPLEVCRWPIQWHTRRDEICFEPFGGSGTCLIAAAMEGRRCYALEMSPAFCDVIRQRWTTYARSAGLDVGTGGLDT